MTGKQIRRAGEGSGPPQVGWDGQTELVKVSFVLQSPLEKALSTLPAVGLHAWFLDQMRRIDPQLSSYLHDGGSEKPFALSDLSGPLIARNQQPYLQAGQMYRWSVSALSQPVAGAIAEWLQARPEAIDLRQIVLDIQTVEVEEPATTYAQLREQAPTNGSVTLSFLTPTSFRRKGHHLPLPWPANVFQSYLRRWNDFSGEPIDPEAFVSWVDEGVILHRHRIESQKVAAGKSGSVTGFVGAVEFGLTHQARSNEPFTRLFFALAALAPYCGTGHKTTFGLGQTALGWQQGEQAAPEERTIQASLAERIAQLSAIYFTRRRRTGGERAQHTADTWATILARREFGESLQAIAADLQMPYETVKTYAKLARSALRPD